MLEGVNGFRRHGSLAVSGSGESAKHSRSGDFSDEAGAGFGNVEIACDVEGQRLRREQPSLTERSTIGCGQGITSATVVSTGLVRKGLNRAKVVDDGKRHEREVPVRIEARFRSGDDARRCRERGTRSFCGVEGYLSVGESIEISGCVRGQPTYLSARSRKRHER